MRLRCRLDRTKNLKHVQINWNGKKSLCVQLKWEQELNFPDFKGCISFHDPQELQDRAPGIVSWCHSSYWRYLIIWNFFEVFCTCMWKVSYEEQVEIKNMLKLGAALCDTMMNSTKDWETLFWAEQCNYKDIMWHKKILIWSGKKSSTTWYNRCI